LFPKLTHAAGLVSNQPHVTEGSASAGQDKTFPFVLVEISSRQALIHFAAHEPRCAREAAPLMADGRQDDSVPLRGIPDHFICAAAERMFALGGVQNYQIVTRYLTPSAYVPCSYGL